MKTDGLSASISFIDSWLALLWERGEIPGFVVAIADKGKIVFKKAYGYANLEKKEKLTTSHIFRIASHSKIFTATAIMQLAERGHLRIDDHVVDYLPWLKQHQDKRFLKVTIRQLLSHTAGVIRDGLVNDYWALLDPFPNEKQLRTAILKSSLVFDTNIQMKYSNFGYSLLGLVIEAGSGKTYNQYVIEHIVQPLGLKDTGPDYSGDYSRDLDDKLVTGHSRADLNKTRLSITGKVETNSMSSATGFYSTVADLCKYFAAQKVGTKLLLNDESKKEMQRAQCRVTNSKQSEEYGLGFIIEYLSSRCLFGHRGGFPGQRTSSLSDSKSDLFVVVLTNCIDASPGAINKSIFSVIDHFLKNGSASQSKKKLHRFQGRFMELWSILEFVVLGDKIVAIDPTSWQPFDDAEELEYVDEKTLKVVKTNAFASEGELIHFTFSKSGEIKTVLVCGTTMWPQDQYMKMLAKKKKIG